MDIRFIPQSEIDKVKWNSCVHYANNGNIFGYMWYLNNTAEEWDALVEGDYETILPLPWKEGGWRKNRVFYQPDLIREMGPYSINALSKKRVRTFLEAIPEHFQLIDIQISEQIGQVEHLDFKATEKYNHQLLLTEPYETIADHYSSEFLRQLENTVEAQLRPSGTLKPEKIVDFYQKHNARELGSTQNYHAYLRIMYNVLHRGWGFAAGVEDASGELVAVSFFVYSHNKTMRLLSAQSPVGARQGALAFSYDLLVRTHAGRPLILDFNSSGENELAKQMGAQENIYYRLLRDQRKGKIL